ncbi:mucin-associated surface protein [Arthrobacter sp. KBS0702]|uniref:mucin-associated surface protein n=1 Tax=Arthrobacter sp. KBS0702 TaxID=2578107 RepID=UPI0021BD4756|nr:mucin-associated surface protein [Arthrobacter sp. KBS0702]
MIGKSTRRWSPALAAPVLTAVLVAGSLSGCAGTAPELDGGAATQLQSQVLAVTEAAATEDSAGALKLLDELMTKLDAAAADGKVSFKRHQSIKASVDVVRADLTAKIAQQQAAAAEAAKAAAAAQAAAQEAAAKAAADQTAAQAPAPAPAPADNGKAKGKGKGGG